MIEQATRAMFLSIWRASSDGEFPPVPFPLQGAWVIIAIVAAVFLLWSLSSIYNSYKKRKTIKQLRRESFIKQGIIVACNNCGMEIIMKCPDCGKQLHHKLLYCPLCGKPLGETR